MSATLLLVTEIMIFICGAGAILLLNMNNKYSKYGAVIGLIGQPFWFISAARGESWGILTVSVLYTIAYIIGVYNFWIKEKGK